VRSVQFYVERLDDVPGDLICEAVRVAGDSGSALYEFELRGADRHPAERACHGDARRQRTIDDAMNDTMKRALVTGGSGGIGAAICKQLGSMGHFVYVHANLAAAPPRMPW
jgi:hypothetical protein